MIDLLQAIAEAYRTKEAAAPSPFELLRLQAMLYEESQRTHDLLLGSLSGAAGSAAPEGPGDELAELLRRVQRALFRHPVAAQAAFAALMAEGRRFAGTPEGAAWKAALEGSELARNGRRLWDALSMGMLEEDPATIVPSAYLEALLRAAASADLDALLGKLGAAPGGGERGAPR